MKLVIIIMFLLSPFLHGQISYAFDHSLVYETTFYKHDSLIQERIFLINSKDNSYYAVLNEIDSLDYRLILHDRKALHADLKIKKAVYEGDVDINVDCKNVASYVNKSKKLINTYAYRQLKDTVLNAIEYETYKLESSFKPKKIKRKKIGSNIYLVLKDKDSIAPNFEYDIAYAMWLKDSLPFYGILSQKIFRNYKGVIKTFQKLKYYKKINRSINLLGKCNFSS